MSREFMTYQPAGDLTIFEAASFKDSLVTLLSQEGPVTLDLSRVVRMDTPAAQLLVAATRSGRLTIKGLSKTLAAQLSAIGLTAE